MCNSKYIEPISLLFLSLFTFHFSLCSPAWAREVTVTAKVDKTEATLEDSILLSLTVSGIRSSPTPTLPDLPDFSVQEGGTASQINIINGQMQSNTIFNYVLIPHRAGNFSIGPATVEVKGDTYRSQPIEVRILPVSSQHSESGEIYVEQSVSTQNPYRNQQVVYTFRFIRRVATREAKLEEPEYEGFLVEPLGDQKDYKRIIKGKEYIVTEINKVLFPTRTGRVVINEAKLACDVIVQKKQKGRPRSLLDDFFDDSFFGMAETKTKFLRAEPIEMAVRELPLQGRPKDFDGLVGDISVATRLEKGSLPVGDSTTLSVVVSGDGNLRNLELPPVVGVSDFKVYDDRPVYKQKIGGGKLIGTRTFKRALVPLQEGEFRVPPVSISYFDPDTGRYQVAQGDWLEISVSPPAEKEKFTLVESARTEAGAAVKVLGQDILPPHTRIRLLRDQSVKARDPVIWAGLLAPFFGFLVSFLVFTRREADRKDTAGLRRRKAYPRFRGGFHRARVYLDREDPEVFRALSRAVRDYLGDWFNISGVSLTPAEAEDLVKKNTSDPELARAAREVLERLESYQFGASVASSGTSKEMYRAVKKLAQDLHKALKS